MHGRASGFLAILSNAGAGKWEHRHCAVEGNSLRVFNLEGALEEALFVTGAKLKSLPQTELAGYGLELHLQTTKKEMKLLQASTAEERSMWCSALVAAGAVDGGTMKTKALSKTSTMEGLVDLHWPNKWPGFKEHYCVLLTDRLQVCTKQKKTSLKVVAELEVNTNSIMTRQDQGHLGAACPLGAMEVFCFKNNDAEELFVACIDEEYAGKWYDSIERAITRRKRAESNNR